MPLDLDQLRAQFPVARHHTYLNHAGLGPLPQVSADAGAEALRSQALHGLVEIADWERTVERTRSACARLVGRDADEVAFVRSTSHGLSLVAAGIDWRPGDVVLCATSEEYPSNVYPWQRLAARGVELRTVAAPDGSVEPARFAEAGCARTRLVVVSSVQYATGWRVDLAALGELCRARGWWLCVDAIQSLGAIPLDAAACGVHFLAADAHKWMLGPPGIGVLSVARGVPLDPVVVGWRSTREALNFDQVKLDLRDDAARFEEGSLQYALIAAMGASVELLLEVGLDAVWERIRGLTDPLREALDAQGEEVLDTPTPNRSGSVFFRPTGSSTEERARALAERGVVVATRRGRIRVSPHVWNTAEEVERVWRSP